MTAPHIVDPAGLLGEALAEASPDLMRSLLQSIINALLCADADAVVGAEYGRPSPSRTAQRNGYRHRDLDTRVGTIDVAIPKLRAGTYFPEWLLERRKRAESALITVVADCYLAGVSTRRMDKLVKQLGIDSLSKSQVCRLATDLDSIVEDFRHRPLDAAGPFTFVAADALTMKVREGGRVINAVVLLATGVNGDGHREVLGMRVATSETGLNSFQAGPVSLDARRDQRNWAGLERVLRRSGGPRPERRPLGHQRRAPWTQGRDRCEPGRVLVATLPHPLCRPPDYADVVADSLAGWGFCAGEVGIIRALRARRAVCRMVGIGRACCSAAGFWPAPSP